MSYYIHHSMKFFALNTNLADVKQDFLTLDEQEVHTTHYHWMSFFFAILREIIYSIFFIGAVSLLGWAGVPLAPLISIAFFLWIFFIFFHLIKAYIDWRYDFILITTDKVILIDQSSIFQRKITPITLDNFASISSQTQFLNIFRFGKIVLNLKEGVGAEIALHFIPDAGRVAGVMADCVTKFQRRRGTSAEAQPDNIAAGE